MDPGELRNFKEFLLLYNKISEDCFKKCVFDMTNRGLGAEEADCISTCAQKHINVNHKTMQIFAEVNPAFQERKATEREAEFLKMQEENAKAKDEADAKSKTWYSGILGMFGGSSTLATATVVSTGGDGDLAGQAASGNVATTTASG